MSEKPQYYPGQECRCGAFSQYECSCEVDWTDPEIYSLRARLSAAEKLLGCEVENHPDFEKTQENNTMVGVWRYDGYPYFLCGNVDKFYDDNRATIKEYGPGYHFTLIKVLYGEEGDEFIEKFKKLRDDHEQVSQNFRNHWKEKAIELLGKIDE